MDIFIDDTLIEVYIFEVRISMAKFKRILKKFIVHTNIPLMYVYMKIYVCVYMSVS